MNEQQWHDAAMRLAHAWAMAAYYKALQRNCDIDGAREALAAHLRKRPSAEQPERVA
jgi:hypothetical protein